MSFADHIRSALGHKDNKDRAVRKSPAFENEWLAFRGEDLAQKEKMAVKRCAALAAALAACGLLVFIGSELWTHYMQESVPSYIERSDSEQQIHLELALSYKGTAVSRGLTLSVKPRRISFSRAQEMFDECESWLKEQLAGGPVFPDEAPNGVVITWEDSDFSYLGETPLSSASLAAQLSAGEYFRVCEFYVPLAPGPKDYEESLEKLAERIEDELSTGDLGTVVPLPQSREGASLKWKWPKAQLPLMLLMLCLFSAVFIWFSRRDGLKRMLEKRRTEFEREISDMSFQMILLLNAGLVVESAFLELLRQNRDSASPLYRIFRDISERAASGNVSFVNELYSFAQSSRSSDLIRFSTLVYEHAGRGSSLADKLQQERDIMWQSRVSLAKTRVRQAETKLCFPLILLLLSLIIITAVPSFLGM